jgi:hypothetical protein
VNRTRPSIVASAPVRTIRHAGLESPDVWSRTRDLGARRLSSSTHATILLSLSTSCFDAHEDFRPRRARQGMPISHENLREPGGILAGAPSNLPRLERTACEHRLRRRRASYNPLGRHPHHHRATRHRSGAANLAGPGQETDAVPAPRDW